MTPLIGRMAFHGFITRRFGGAFVSYIEIDIRESVEKLRKSRISR